MRINGFQCEQCKTMHSLPERYNSLDYAHRSLPENWLSLIRGNGENTDPMHFCSEECLHQWVLAQGADKADGLNEQQRQALEKMLREVRREYIQALKVSEQRCPTAQFHLNWTFSLNAYPIGAMEES